MIFENRSDNVGTTDSGMFCQAVQQVNEVLRRFEAYSPFAHMGISKMSIS
jgi:hypothetical protein